jgi:hypothetical protein
LIHWVTFDEETADLISAKLHVSPEPVANGNALHSALQVNTGTSFALLRSGSREEVLMARFAWNRAPSMGLTAKPEREKQESSHDSPSVYQAGGFLGLSDEAVYEPEETQPAKKWWRKILD